ncbi:MAG: aldo/keto reductase [Gemmatimonadaceae bacterium]|nr:aldo/keto reductase [Gemmatimonadaceae bacterium]
MASSDRLAIGTAQFGLAYGVANVRGQVSRDEAAGILAFASSAGIHTIDTAAGYGESETRLGDIGVKGWELVSKLPAIPRGCRDIQAWVEEVARESLTRLRVECLYGFLLHRPSELLEDRGPELYSAMTRLKELGIVRAIGISIYDPSELDEIMESHPMDIVQAPFNLLDRRLEDTGWMQRISASGAELHVRSVFLQGLLLMKNSERPAKFGRWVGLWDHYDSWLADSGLTALEACLSFALSFPEIHKVIVGIDSLRQLKEILAASDHSYVAPPDGLRSADTSLINPGAWPALS